MEISLVDALHDALTTDIIGQTSALLDERPANTREAIDRAARALLDGLSERASSPAAADRLLDLIHRAGQRDALAGLASGGLTFEALEKAGGRTLVSILAGRAPEIAARIAATCGLRRRSAATVLTLAAPIVMGMVRDEMAARKLDAAGLVPLLSDFGQPRLRAITTMGTIGATALS